MDPGKTRDDIPRTPGSSKSGPSDEDPNSVEEFSIRERLGHGGFGRVFLAYDNTLQREVALKIPHTRLVGRPETVELYLREARAIASLDHPCIIPVYRAAKTPQIPCYIVTKRIRGCDLGKWHARYRPTFATLAHVLAQVADALAYAHKNGVVHRDIKPSNILIDENDHPYVADFGLALRDVDPKGGPAYVGTPAYMSPEQARGEGHRVDGRSDIFSMGVLMFELLTGSRPFQSSDQRELTDAILYNEPEHPCQLNSEVPVELASICLKCMSKGMGDRYQSADLLAAELRAAYVPPGSTVIASRSDQDGSTVSRVSDTQVAQKQDEQRVVPKGLRPFDLRDADFFLRLLPGPRDREGVPEIVRFWVSRIEPTGSDQSVSVGLIYGPSGCGKTSLVRAGLVPRLSSDVRTIYVQATGEGTEQKLTGQITSRLESLGLLSDQPRDIVEAFATLRRQRKKRTVIFIDQFEQWLFAHPDCLREPLTQALRQCDGEYLQCILMVRDDFWMGVTRLVQALDLTIAENVNVTAVDLFDVRHARNVLRMFGIAYGRLPESASLTPNQDRFLDAAVDYLSTDGRVICVQLALLTEMLKNRSWEKTTRLFRDGGADIGMQFFDETFDSEKSPRRIRIHSDGTLRVLRALLPESGSRIKGAICTEQALFQASRYPDKQSFRQLISILDHELHLITPTDRSDTDSVSSNSSISGSMSTGYQLTHDFLIAPIRQWVEYQNRSSREGKARLRLEEFSDLYHARPRPQSLPTIGEYAVMRRFVSPSSYNQSQQKMMSAALRRHLRSVGTWLLGLAVLGVGIYAAYGAIQRQNQATIAQSAVARLLDANMAEAVELSKQLRTSELARLEATALVDDDQAALSRRVRAALVVADTSPRAAELLTEFSLTAAVDDVVQLARGSEMAIRAGRAAAPQVWQSQTASRADLVRAACLMANDPQQRQTLGSPEEATRLVKLLIAENPVWIKRWSEGFEPVATDLISPLVDLLSDEARAESSLNAVNLLVQYAGDDTGLLASLIPTAHRAELIVLSDALSQADDKGLAAVQHQWDRENAADQVRVDLSQPWGSPWWCVSAREPLQESPPASELSDSLQQQLEEEFESVIAPHAIVSHKIPIKEIDGVAEALASAGYRVAELFPYAMGKDRFLMVLWIRDGARSRLILDATPAELRAINEQYRNEGLIPDTVGVYRHPGDEPIRYAGVWIQTPDNIGVIEGDIYIDVPDDLHQQEGWGKLAERGIGLPRSNFMLRKKDGFEYFTSVRWRIEVDIGYHDRWNLDWSQYDAIQKYGRALATLSTRASMQTSDSARHGATTVWWTKLPVQAREIGYQGRREHLRLTRQRLEDGDYPVSIHATVMAGDPTPLFRSTWWRPRRDESEVTRRSKRLRNIAIALFRLGRQDEVQSVLEDTTRGSLRGEVIAAFHRYELKPDWLAEKIADKDNSSVLRRSCAMALSLYPVDSIPQPVHQAALTQLPALYADANDPGLGSAIEAVASAWGFSLDANGIADSTRELKSIADDRLVIVHPTDPVWIGSPVGEPGRDPMKESEVPVQLAHSYAIATREVTVAQYLKFRPDHGYAKDYARSDDCPIINVNWFDAARRYCRWLSQQEGIPESQMCYPRIDEIKPGMGLEEGFQKRFGYRLPTEAEWEYACRGGVELTRWFGFDPERLAEHAWTTQNSEYRLHPVGRLLPNDYGLFDMLGNAMEFCHSTYESYPQCVSQPIVDPGSRVLSIDSRSRMINRGGANLYQPLDARASQREYHGADAARVYITFRIARTVAPEE